MPCSPPGHEDTAECVHSSDFMVKGAPWRCAVHSPERTPGRVCFSYENVLGRNSAMCIDLEVGKRRRFCGCYVAGVQKEEVVWYQAEVMWRDGREDRPRAVALGQVPPHPRPGLSRSALCG